MTALSARKRLAAGRLVTDPAQRHHHRTLHHMINE
jgi:hypothetical protein